MESSSYDADRQKVVDDVSDALLRHQERGGVVGEWSYNGPAILSAVKSAGKVGKVKIVCFDEEPDTLAGVKSGAIAATIVQQPYQFGYLSVKVMHDYLKGDKSAIPASKQRFVPTLVIKKDSVDEFSAELKKLRA